MQEVSIVTFGNNSVRICRRIIPRHETSVRTMLLYICNALMIILRPQMIHSIQFSLNTLTMSLRIIQLMG